jgi:HAD superfamily hydrolase (TIGR01458 family)
MACMKNIRGFLIDLDGVMYVGDSPVEGAVETLDFLENHGYKYRFVSNTTRKSRKTIVERLSKMGLDIPEKYIFTPPLAAITFMKNAGKSRCRLLVTGDVGRDFQQVSEYGPGDLVDFVVIGDAGDKITYDSMNTAFRALMDGAELIALEKDRYWMAPDGLALSAGPFVSALEFASGKTAVVVGKPSKDFFRLALNDMEINPEQAAMIGDDITTDIGGAQIAGMKGILVRTGKSREDRMKKSDVKPDYIVDSIAGLKDLLQSDSGKKA